MEFSRIDFCKNIKGLIKCLVTSTRGKIKNVGILCQLFDDLGLVFLELLFCMISISVLYRTVCRGILLSARKTLQSERSSLPFLVFGWALESGAWTSLCH